MRRHEIIIDSSQIQGKESGSFMADEAFLWHVLGPFVRLEGRINANQCKSLLTDHICAQMGHFSLDWSALFLDDKTDRTTA